MLKALYHTFGCKLNFAETSTIAAMMENRGIRRAQAAESPDFVIINSCSVTEEADKKCRQYIRATHRRYPDAKIVVTGCYAQLKPDEVAAQPGVVIVAGSDRKNSLPDLIVDLMDKVVDAPSTTESMFITPLQQLNSFSPSCSRGDRTRYFLKVQDGCDYWCSYCTIPRARGRSRSGSVDEILAQARAVAEEGGKEIVITGVNIGDFGKGSDLTFLDLIKQLDLVDGIERYRISSIEPNLLTDEIIDFVAESRRFMPHFHIPLQSGSDRVLSLMRRHYDTSLFADKIAKVRSAIPDAFIGVDLIVGARGETQEEFERSRDFVENLDISRLHVFPYSERPGTKALSIPHVVNQHDKHIRAAEMIAISDRKLCDFTSRFIGTTRKVLLEHSSQEGIMGGFTDNYLKVMVHAPSSLDNTIIDAELMEPSVDAPETVIAKQVSEK